MLRNLLFFCCLVLSIPAVTFAMDIQDIIGLNFFDFWKPRKGNIIQCHDQAMISQQPESYVEDGKILAICYPEGIIEFGFSDNSSDSSIYKYDFFLKLMQVDPAIQLENDLTQKLQN